jgi:outer membrane protein assembly factor BamE
MITALLRNNSQFVIFKFTLTMKPAVTFTPPTRPERSMRHRFYKPLIVAMVACVSACVYHAPIQQGNLLDAKDIDQVKVGMTQAQVRYVLGTPMVSDPFSSNRWDYVFYLKLNSMKQSKKQQFVVYFDNDKVSKLERGDVVFYTPDTGTVKKENQPWYRRWFSWLV